MSEKCPHCGKQCADTRALGSHVHYMHGNVYSNKVRSLEEKARFAKLLDSCLSERNLRKPRKVNEVEQAIAEIPEGISPKLDKYRDAFKCANSKDRLLKKVEKHIDEE